MDVVVTIAAFISHLEACGYAAATVASYTANIGHFKRYLERCGLESLKQVTPAVAAQYRREVMDESIAIESKALKLRPVKRLFEHLVATHRLLINPTEGLVETCRKKRKIGPVLSVAEMRRLLAQPDLTLKTGLRNRAVMEVLYTSGIRIGELLSLEVDDADLRAGELFVRKGKGGKARVVPLGKTAAGYLEAYLRRMQPAGALFVNRFGNPLSGASIRAFLRTYRKQAGIAKPVSPHTFRRTCATHLLQQGADIRHIQELLGHRRLSTTQTYTRVLPLEVKATHERSHPKL